MKAKILIALLVLGVCILSGCQFNGRVYPVQGPLATQTPPPVFSAKVTGVFSSGHFTVVFANGEECKGTWSMVSQKPTQGAQGSANASPDLSSAWDRVYGQGFYTAHILGAKLHLQSTLTGSKGTILHVELYRPDTEEGLNEIKGVGIDGDGDIFKLVF